MAGVRELLKHWFVAPGCLLKEAPDRLYTACLSVVLAVSWAPLPAASSSGRLRDYARGQKIEVLTAPSRRIRRKEPLNGLAPAVSVH